MVKTGDGWLRSATGRSFSELTIKSKLDVLSIYVCEVDKQLVELIYSLHGENATTIFNHKEIDEFFEKSKDINRKLDFLFKYITEVDKRSYNNRREAGF